MKKRFSSLLGVLLALSVALAALAGLLYAAGTNAPLMHRMLLRHAPSAATGLPEAEYGPVAEMIAAYLGGNTDEFQYSFATEDGTLQLCFNTKEQQHMVDCAGLFRLCRTALWCVGGLSLALTGMGIILWQERRRLLLAFARTMVAVLLAIALIALWAWMDFEGLFVLFHRLSFTNDLWLLNPATDLLIRLMPTGFFITYAAGIGAAWLMLCLACAACAHMLGRKYLPKTNRGIR